MIVNDLWARFREYGLKFRPSWRTTQATHEPHLLGYFGNIAIQKLSHADVDDYRALRRTELTVFGKYTSPATRNREVCSLTAACKWGVKRRHIATHPLLYIDPEPEAPRPREYLSEQDLTRILSFLAQGGHVAEGKIIQTLYDSGLRLGEALALEARHVQFERGAPIAVQLEAAMTKNKHPRLVPLTNRAAMAVAWGLQRGQRHVFGRDGWKFPDWQVQDRWAAAREALGLSPNLVLHSCRHSCATNLRRRGVDWHLVKEILGHRSERAARVYQHVGGEEYRAAVTKMERGILGETGTTVVVHDSPTTGLIHT